MNTEEFLIFKINVLFMQNIEFAVQTSEQLAHDQFKESGQLYFDMKMVI